jgi:hypothetical protein
MKVDATTSERFEQKLKRADDVIEFRPFAATPTLVIFLLHSVPRWLNTFTGSPLLKEKNQTFRLSDPDFRGRKLLLPGAIHCWKSVGDEIQPLQNLARVTFVTDVIREMVGWKNM